MYIADGQKVLVIDRNRMKLVRQLNTPDMLYPHGIAFCKHLREVYVTGRLSSSRFTFNLYPANVKNMVSF
jgi:hypothetical protein